MEKTKSVFEVLSSINLSSKVEKRGNLSYISWATAWAAVKEHYQMYNAPYLKPNQVLIISQMG